MSARAQDLWARYTGQAHERPDYEPQGELDLRFVRSFEGATEEERVVKARRAQDFFRQAVLTSYGSRCCITGNPVAELLTASHIAPWSRYPQHRTDPRNGLCLAKTQDAAFDRGLISLDEDLCLLVSSELRSHLPDDALEKNFLAFQGSPVRLPDRFVPSQEFLEIHRREQFRK